MTVNEPVAAGRDAVGAAEPVAVQKQKHRAGLAESMFRQVERECLLDAGPVTNELGFEHGRPFDAAMHIRVKRYGLGERRLVPTPADRGDTVAGTSVHE